MSFALVGRRCIAGKEIFVRHERKNQRQQIGHEEHRGNGHGQPLLGLWRPATRLLVGGQVKDRRNDQTDGSQRE